MSSPSEAAIAQAPPTLVDYMRVVWRARWWILAMCVVAAAVAFAVARMQPKVYTARATILQPRESTGSSLSGSLGALMMMGGGGRDGGGGMFSLPGISLGGGGMSTTMDVFMAMLSSRSMQEEVVAEMDKRVGQPVGALVVSIVPDARDKGVIGLTVEAKDPQIAADVANLYFSALEMKLDRLADQAVRRKELIYATQLERAAKEVEAAEHALLKFQSENRFIALDTPTKASVESVVSLRTAIMSLEMQREVVRLRLTDAHPQMRELEKQIAELKRQYSKNLFGEPMDLPPEGPAARGLRKEFFVSASKMTPVQFAFLKVFRNLKIQEAFYTAALQGLQQIKYGDGRLQTNIEFLDQALVPSRPARPNVVPIVAAATVAALVVGALLAFVVESARGARERDRQRRPSPSKRGRGPDNGAERVGVAVVERGRTAEPEVVRAR